MYFMKLTKTALAVALLVAGFGVLSASDAAPVVREHCPLNQAAVVVSTDSRSTTSVVLVDVPESSVRFVQGGTQARCVVVSFSAEAAAAPNDLMVVQAVLDGTIVCQPGSNFFVRSNATATDVAARTMNFVCAEVTPGAHKLKLQFRSRSGGVVQLGFRTLVVHYFK